MAIPGQQPPAIPRSAGMGSAELGQVNDMRSDFNPTDAFMNAKDGKAGSMDMSVTELLASRGIDANKPGSARELADMFMKNMKNADPLQKMKGIAGQGAGGPAPPPPGGMAPGGPQPGGSPMGGGPPPMPGGGGGAGFDQLMKR